MHKSNESTDISFEELRHRIILSENISPSERELLLGILEGRLIAPMTSDTMSKKLFSPDTHPERCDFIMQHVMNNPFIKSAHSAANEPPVESEKSKRSITDLSAWLRDNSIASLEFQNIAREFPFSRSEIYTSRMLLLQYSASENRNKGDIDYHNVNGVILVIIMRNTPDFLKRTDSSRYIHRFTEIVSDSGIRVPLLRKTAFVQLDKALEQYLNNSYNEDEDRELLLELAMLSDPNNPRVKEAAMENSALKDIYTDAASFTSDFTTQHQLLLDELEILDRNSTEKYWEEKGEEKINALYSWLHENNRDSDVWKAMDDPGYRARLLKEFNAVKENK